MRPAIPAAVFTIGLIVISVRSMEGEAAPPAGGGGDGAAVELRALRGYLGLYRRSLDLEQGLEGGSWAETGLDLRARLERFLDQGDLPAPVRADGLGIYRDLARAVALSSSSSPSGRKEGAGGLVPREVYAELVRRWEAAGLDPLLLELEMLGSPGVDLEADEVYSRLAPRVERFLHGTSPLPPEEAAPLRPVLRRLLGEPGWPALDSGERLAAVVELLPLLGEESQEEVVLAAAKLAGWTARLLKAEAESEGERARQAGVIHLYRCLELLGSRLDPARRAAALNGLVPLLPPAIAPAPAGGPGALRSVEVKEVRVCGGVRGAQVPGAVARGPQARGAEVRGVEAGGRAGGGRPIPPLPPSLAPDGASRYYLAPGKAYQVELAVAGAEGGPPLLFQVLARAGPEARLVLPASIPTGMVPATAGDTGRVTFLADQRPWSIQRFLLALQRSWNALADDAGLAARIWKGSVLRELPLAEEGEPSAAALVGLLGQERVRDRLGETFWVDGGSQEGCAAAFEIARVILTANNGLRDSPLALPTAAEAGRLYRDGRRFALEEPAYGLFNATRLVPEPRELGDRPRYAIRAVIQLPSP